jgi:hypothetical protein
LRLGGKNWNAAGGDLWARLQWRFVALFNTMAKDPSSKEKWIFFGRLSQHYFFPFLHMYIFPHHFLSSRTNRNQTGSKIGFKFWNQSYDFLIYSYNASVVLSYKERFSK